MFGEGVEATARPGNMSALTLETDPKGVENDQKPSKIERKTSKNHQKTVQNGSKSIENPPARPPWLTDVQNVLPLFSRQLHAVSPVPRCGTPLETASAKTNWRKYKLYNKKHCRIFERRKRAPGPAQLCTPSDNALAAFAVTIPPISGFQTTDPTFETERNEHDPNHSHRRDPNAIRRRRPGHGHAPLGR